MIKVTGKTVRRVRDTGPSLPRVEPEEVRKAVGAVALEGEAVSPQGPVALFGLRQSLAERLRSTGGRPTLGHTRRQKIPMSDADWQMLCELAEELADEGGSPSPGQVASELLHQRLLELQDKIRAGGGAGRRRLIHTESRGLPGDGRNLAQTAAWSLGPSRRHASRLPAASTTRSLDTSRWSKQRERPRVT